MIGVGVWGSVWKVMQAETKETFPIILHLHQENVFHRDIKLANIFLSSSDTLKIGDFGFSRRISGKR